MNVKIALLADFSGPSKRVGEGIYNSFQYVISRHKKELSRKGISIEIIKYDDKYDPVESVDCVAKACKDDCVLIIGPADSACASFVIRSKANEPVPILLSFATNTFENFEDAENVFRVTSPGWRRSEMLIESIIAERSDALVSIFTLEGPSTTYAQGLKKDIETICAERGIDVNSSVNFHLGLDGFPALHQDGGSIIICSPSYEGSKLVEHLR